MEECVLDTISVYLANVEVFANGFYVLRGDAVGGAVDAGGLGGCLGGGGVEG